MAGRLNKICIYSNSPHTNTGYSTQVTALTKFLQDDGYGVSILSNSGIADNAIHWQGVDIYPSRMNPFDFKLAHEFARHAKADAVLSLYDLFPLSDTARQDLDYPWIAWCPVDGTPPPDRMLNVAKQAEWLLSMSKFGHEELAGAGLPNTYVPLGIDCDVFCPGDRKEARERLGLPQGAFIVGVVAANKGWPCRKSWPEMIMAFAQFHNRFPRNTLLYLHTTRLPYGSRDGMNIDALVARTGLGRNIVQIAAESDIAIGIPPETMADLYRSFDVLLGPSMGEGFDLPSVECQACGTPVITQDCTAMTEHTFLGHCLKPLQPFYVPQLNYWWYLASIPRIVEALTAEYQHPSTLDERAVKKAIFQIRQRYHWPDVYEKHWKPVLETVERQMW